jgi:hypothetical protein
MREGGMDGEREGEKRERVGGKGERERDRERGVERCVPVTCRPHASSAGCLLSFVVAQAERERDREIER